VKVGEFEVEVTSSQSDSGWVATGILPDGQKIISGPASSQKDAIHDVMLQAEARLYPMKKIEFTKKFESKEQAVVSHMADSLLEANFASSEERRALKRPRRFRPHPKAAFYPGSGGSAGVGGVTTEADKLLSRPKAMGLIKMSEAKRLRKFRTRPKAAEMQVSWT